MDIWTLPSGPGSRADPVFDYYYGADSSTAVNTSLIGRLTKTKYEHNANKQGIELNNQYAYFAFPASLGKMEFKVGVLWGGFNEPVKLSINSIEYNVYRSVQILKGKADFVFRYAEMQAKDYLGVEYMIRPKGGYAIMEAENIDIDGERVDAVIYELRRNTHTNLSKIEKAEGDIVELQSQIQSIGKTIKIKGRVNTVSDLPETAEEGDMYFVGTATAESFEEYVYTEQGKWEYLGSINDIDLSDYVTKSFLSNTLGEYAKLSDIPTVPTNYLTGGSQTSKSAADGGKNVYTFTKSDGTTSTLEVFNGTKGSKGDTGPQGEQGIQGIQGPQGLKGDTGSTGATGPQGPKGDTGATGATGPQGPKGDTGDTGPQGPAGKNGTNGSNGVSCTHSWSGTTLSVTSASGTSSANLKGEKGDKGDTGATGATGATGPQGPKGDTGATGPQGPKGDTGDTGPQGPAGKNGTNGSNGVSCTHSWSGTTLSVTSASGTSSANLKGDKGDKGDTGATGATGPQGPAGTNGTTPTIKAANGTNIGTVGTPSVSASTSGTTTTFTFNYLKGAKGDKGDKGDTGAAGADGKNGTNGSNGVSCTHSWSGTTLSVTSASGTSSANLKGDKGDKGDTGATGATGPQGPAGQNATTTAVFSTSANGLAPKSTNTSNFLRGDGTWQPVITSHQDISGKLDKSGGTMSGNLIMGDGFKSVIMRNNASWKSGIGYDTKGNEALSLWATNSVTRLRWYAGKDMSSMASGTMMDITPDFEVSKADGTAKAYIAGSQIAVKSDIPSVATTSANGLMSSADKTKLDGIATGATAVTTSTVSGWGFTKNAGTVTSVAVKMNGATKGTVTGSGTIDLGTVLTSHQSLANYVQTTDSRLSDSRNAKDVYSWAKASSKPSYNTSEISGRALGKNLIGKEGRVLYPVFLPAGSVITFSTKDGSNKTANESPRLRLYDLNKNFLDSWTAFTGSNYRTVTLNVSNDIYYIAWQTKPTFDIMVEKGGTKTTYEDYKYSPSNLELMEMFMKFDMWGIN